LKGYFVLDKWVWNTQNSIFAGHIIQNINYSKQYMWLKYILFK
jgi:hypothetical protein